MPNFLKKVLLILSVVSLQSPHIAAMPSFSLANPDKRTPKGIWKSPYSLSQLSRYAANFMSNGLFSYQNPDRAQMKSLPIKGSIKLNNSPYQTNSNIKIVLLGDIMLSKSGQPPHLDDALQSLLRSADIIIANVESSVVKSSCGFGRSLSLRFEMPIGYLQKIYDVNPYAQWVFSVANNHAFDTCKDAEDIKGLVTSITTIKQALPNAHVIGAEIDSAQAVLCLQIPKGPKIGVVGWTDLMNHDSRHYKKSLIRAQDITPNIIKIVKEQGAFDLLIGFAHGNEEQSYEPLKETRDRWNTLIGPQLFDVIIGTGPHVVQAGEAVNKCLLFHSIGNFCSPTGRSQTKIGCIPALTLTSSVKGMQLSYTAHFIQQHNELISLFSLNDKEVLYPSIVKRLRIMWGLENGVNAAYNFNKILLVSGLLGLGYLAYKYIY